MILEIILIGLGVLVFLTLCGIGWVIGIYNTFVNGDQDVNNQLSNIKTEFQRRADLFYNLVESVKSHKNFEKDTLVQLAAARSGNFNFGKTNAESVKKLQGLDAMFSKLMVVFERYPKLKSDKLHADLMQEIRITEDRINIARTDYNALVNDYNVLVLEFPNALLARPFGFKKAEYLECEPGAEKAPKIDLGGK